MWRVSIPVFAVIVGGCQGATGVMLDVTTDLPCVADKTVTTAISAGPVADYEARAPIATTTRCDADGGRIGSLVIVPSDDKSAELAIEVTTAVAGKDPSACKANATGCIVARRVLHYSPHVMIELSVMMQASCVGVTCGATESCTDGHCIAAAVVADAGADAATMLDSGAAADSAPPPPPPPTCAAGSKPGGQATCCGTTWCVGSDCASLCASCEMMNCTADQMGFCNEAGGPGGPKVKCAH